MRRIHCAVWTALLCAAVAPAQEADAGKKQFEARCAACHGADGGGGERGPNIVDPRRPRARSADSLREVIRNGIPEAGMPAFPIAKQDLDQIVGFILALRAPAAEHP